MRRRALPLAHVAAALLLIARPALAGHFVIGIEDMDCAPIMRTDSRGELRGFARDLFANSASCAASGPSACCR